MTRPGSPERARARFEAHLPLLKLMVGRVLPGYPAGARPLVLAGAMALWLAALRFDDTHGGSFGEAAEVAVGTELLGLVHMLTPPPQALPPELMEYLDELEELARTLGHSTALMPYYGALTAPRSAALTPEFVAPPGREAAMLDGLLTLLRRRWPLIAGMVLVTELLVGLFTVRAPKLYKATATLNTGIASGQQLSGAQVDWFKAGALMGNIVEMLESRTVLERTASRLNLPLVPEKLQKLLTVDKVGQTDLLRINATARTPVLAADLANTHAAEFIRYYQQTQGEDARHADHFVSGQVRASAARLREAEERLRAFKAANVPEAQTTLSAQLAELEAQRGEVERSLRASESGLRTVEAELGRLRRDPGFARSVADATEVETAGERSRALEQNLADARALYGEGHPVVRQLKAQVAKASSAIRSTAARVAAADPAHADVIARRIALKVEVAESSAKLSNLDRALAELRPRARQASISDITYKQLQREVAVREAEYERLQERSSTTRMAAHGASNLPISVVDPAVPPRKAESAKGALKLALGAVLALIAGLVAAYLLELRAQRQLLAEAEEAA